MSIAGYYHLLSKSSWRNPFSVLRMDPNSQLQGPEAGDVQQGRWLEIRGWDERYIGQHIRVARRHGVQTRTFTAAGMGQNRVSTLMFYCINSKRLQNCRLYYLQSQFLKVNPVIIQRIYVHSNSFFPIYPFCIHWFLVNIHKTYGKSLFFIGKSW